ncbi:STAS domain-containing protein [Salinispira pacifica]
MADSPKILSLEGALTVDRATQLRSEIWKHAESGDALMLDFNDATAIDLSFIQLIYASSRYFAGRGSALGFSGTLSPEIGRMLEIGGFCRKAPAEAAELAAVLFDLDSGAKSAARRG